MKNKIGNVNFKVEDCVLACCMCGATDCLALVAHRNKKSGFINGFLTCCPSCDPKNKDLIITDAKK